MISEQDITRILAEYDVGGLWRSVRVQRGYVNEKWLLETAKGRYLLKRRHSSLSEPDLVVAQHALMQHLQQAGFPVPTLLRTRRSTTFLLLQDRVYEMQAFVEGDPCDPRDPVQLAAAAHALGWFHNVVQGFDHQRLHRPSERYGPVSLAQIFERLRREWRGQISSHVEVLVRELENHIQDLAASFRQFGPLPELVIHGDYHADNLIVRGCCVIGVVDYDLAHWCSRAMEVAEALLAFATEGWRRFKVIVYRGVLDLNLVYRFLGAYQGAAALSNPEIHALPHLIRTIWLCASFSPPLEPALSLEAAPGALPEVLALARWAKGHASEIIDIGMAARAEQALA